jgi:hypothetical protein
MQAGHKDSRLVQISTQEMRQQQRAAMTSKHSTVLCPKANDLHWVQLYSIPVHKRTPLVTSAAVTPTVCSEVLLRTWLTQCSARGQCCGVCWPQTGVL